jgi:tRNA-Thr(GGU) m(6)t(6)A37 methyltransferase TsaA
VQDFSLQSIGMVETPFVQKLGIPRQPSLAPSVKGKIILKREFAREDTLRGIESFSHLWILYWCHKSDSWRETIRPPRLGGKEKVGFLATRSPHRPNPIGLSVVKFEGIDSDKNLIISGMDILDQTPVLDIKPYLPMWDSIPQANNGWIDSTEKLISMPVSFDQLAPEQFEELDQEQIQGLRETLCWDPRPAYTKDNDRTFIHQVFDLEVTWKWTPEEIQVLAIKRV